MAEQTKLLFKYSMKKVLEKIEDVRPLLHKIFENGTQIRMRKMFQGRELVSYYLLTLVTYHVVDERSRIRQ